MLAKSRRDVYNSQHKCVTSSDRNSRRPGVGPHSCSKCAFPCLPENQEALSKDDASCFCFVAHVIRAARHAELSECYGNPHHGTMCVRKAFGGSRSWSKRVRIVAVTVICSSHSHGYVCRHPRTGSWQPEFFGSLIESDHGLVLIFSRAM